MARPKVSTNLFWMALISVKNSIFTQIDKNESNHPNYPDYKFPPIGG